MLSISRNVRLSVRLSVRMFVRVFTNFGIFLDVFLVFGFWMIFFFVLNNLGFWEFLVHPTVVSVLLFTSLKDALSPVCGIFFSSICA